MLAGAIVSSIIISFRNLIIDPPFILRLKYPERTGIPRAGFNKYLLSRINHRLSWLNDPAGTS